MCFKTRQQPINTFRKCNCNLNLHEKRSEDKISLSMSGSATRMLHHVTSSCLSPCSVIRISPSLPADLQSVTPQDVLLVSLRYGLPSVSSADVYTLVVFLQMFTYTNSGGLCFTQAGFTAVFLQQSVLMANKRAEFQGHFVCERKSFCRISLSLCFPLIVLP